MDTIHTLQQFMLHTKNIIYILMIVALLGMLAFWAFINGRDEE